MKQTTAVFIWIILIVNSFVGILAIVPYQAGGAQVESSAGWFNTGEGALSVDTGDFDGGNGTDIVTANWEMDNVSVFLNSGTGGYIVSNYSVGNGPGCVVVGDLDEDGHEDLAVANTGNDSISVLLNNGSGGFESHVEYALGAAPLKIALGDINGNDGPDIVASLFEVGLVALLINDGDGAFGAPVPLAVGQNPQGVDTGDVNNDGHIDIVTANKNDSKVSLLLNNGVNGFYPKVDFNTAFKPNSVTLVDLDGDQYEDIVTCGKQRVTILRYNGTGVERSENLVGRGATSVTAGDIDGDGDPDILTTNGNDHTITVLYNDGNGKFRKSIDYPVGTFPKDIAIADMENDSDLDVITVNYCAWNIHPFGTPYVTILANNGMGSFCTGRRDVAFGQKPDEFALADLNMGTFGLNLVVTNGYQITIKTDNLVGLFGNRTTINAQGIPTSLAIGDTDAKNGDDIIITIKGQKLLKIYPNGGIGNFSDANNLVLSGSTDDISYLEETARIVVVNKFEDNISVYDTVNGMAVWKSNHSTVQGPERIAVGDVNDNGFTDVAVSNGKEITVWRADGIGDLDQQNDYNVALDAFTLLDLTGDDRAEIIGVSESNNYVEVYYNALGLFQADSKRTYTTGNGPTAVAVGDMDGDTFPDIVTANKEDDTVSIFMNKGDGTFGSRTDYTVNEEPHEIQLADVDFDGKLDIATLSAANGGYAATVMINQGDGIFWEDSDSDGFGDDSDDFPIDPDEWLDSDSDGYGDFFDALPWNRLEYVDADGDYYGDTFSDVFPTDRTQWRDSDGDGFGDNVPGSVVSIRGVEYNVSNGDEFPYDPLEWVDSDDDGYGNNRDTFPYNNSEWNDTDYDGHGDNSDWDPLNPYEWLDTDGDDVGDNRDAFPYNDTEWNDTDSDGHGDNSDWDPLNPSEWMDADGDDVGDNRDAFP